MGLFDSDWEKLHKRFIWNYELLCLDWKRQAQTNGPVDVLRVASWAMIREFPEMNDSVAGVLVQAEYLKFKAFDVRSSIAEVCHKRNPQIHESDIDELLEGTKKRFLGRSSNDGRLLDWNFFLYFLISRIVEMKRLSISRGAYLIEIASGNIPQPSRLFRFFQVWHLSAQHAIIKKDVAGP